MNLAILTAALNEAAALRKITKNMPPGYDLFVVDDGSVDGTELVARNAGAKVIRHCVNLGQGYAFISGIKAIITNKIKEYEYIVFLDADGQHDPTEIPIFIEKAKQENLDVVVGSRILGSNYKEAPFVRKAFLPFYSHIISKLTGYNMTDAMCGFRAFKVSALKRVIHIFDQMLEPQYLASEMFIRFAKEGLTIGEIPIHMQDRTKGHSYKGTIRYGWGVLRAIIRTLVDKNYRKGTIR
ncbi:MAG: glycosyltransferase family 2 protein [Deltaproteobacteria bacterium]|nr:glycosyltransferase family 2 protein [Deltaproteobacteria bacterium]MBW2333675.1 glycosyltransferase family 2 protein [Deltaproteobacteria bacterium]